MIGKRILEFAYGSGVVTNTVVNDAEKDKRIHSPGGDFAKLDIDRVCVSRTQQRPRRIAAGMMDGGQIRDRASSVGMGEAELRNGGPDRFGRPRQVVRRSHPLRPQDLNQYGYSCRPLVPPCPALSYSCALKAT